MRGSCLRHWTSLFPKSLQWQPSKAEERSVGSMSIWLSAPPQLGLSLGDYLDAVAQCQQ